MGKGFLKHSKGFWLAVAVVAFVSGTALRAPMLDRASSWEDDYSNFDRADMSLPELFAIQEYQGPADTIFDIHPPLSYAAFKAAFFFDRSALAARCVSLLAGAVAIFAVFLLGRALLCDAAGALAALLTALSIEHAYLARIIKTYSLFFACIVLAAWFLVRALQDNRWRDWCGFILGSTAMLYAGYQGAVILAGFFLFGLWRLAPQLRRGRFRSAKDAAVRFGASALAIGLAYAPWIPAVLFLRRFLAKPGLDPLAGLDFAFAAKILEGFLAADFGADRLWLAAWAAAATLGVIGCIARKKYQALVLLLTCSALNVVALVFSQTRLRPLLEHRHFIFVYLAWLLFAAQGALEAGGLLARLVRRASARPAATALFAALFCLGLAAPGFSRFEGMYSWNLTRHRELFQWLAFHKNNVQALDFLGDKRNMMAFAARWHLPGLYQEAGTWDEPGYRRAYFQRGLSVRESVERPDFPGLPVLRAGDENGLIWINAVGLLSGAPLAPFPDASGRYVFAEDFSTLSFFETCREAANMKLDLSLGMLRPSRYSRPAGATWAFDFSGGPLPKSARLDLSPILYKRVMDVPSDSKWIVEVSGDGKTFVDLGEIGQEAFSQARTCPSFDQIDFFDGQCHPAEVSYPIDPAMFAGSGRLFARVSYQPGTREGYLGLGGLRLEADYGAPGTAEDAQRALERRLNNLLRNGSVEKWAKDRAPVGQGLFAFAAPDFAETLARRAEIGSADDYAAYLAAHPQDAPVFVLRDGQGRPAVFFHDPALADPGLSLDAATPEVAFERLGETPFTPGSLLLSGRLRAPTLELGGARLPLPVDAPQGSVLSVNRFDQTGGDGRARLIFTPDWSRPDLVADADYAQNVRAVRAKGESGLETAGDGYGALVWRIVSAFPITEARIGYYASVYGDPCSKCEPNVLRASFMADGKPTGPVEEIQGEECEWSSKYRFRYHRFVFDKPVTSFRAQFEFFGKSGGARLVTFDDPLYASFIECELDARALAGFWPVISSKQGRLSLSGDPKNAFRVYFEPRPMPSLRKLFPAW